jgi:hypothetical protein
MHFGNYMFRILAPGISFRITQKLYETLSGIYTSMRDFLIFAVPILETLTVLYWIAARECDFKNM